MDENAFEIPTHEPALNAREDPLMRPVSRPVLPDSGAVFACALHIQNHRDDGNRDQAKNAESEVPLNEWNAAEQISCARNNRHPKQSSEGCQADAKLYGKPIAPMPWRQQTRLES